MKFFPFLFFCLLLAIAVKVLNFNGLYGQDAYEYYKCTCEFLQVHEGACHFPMQYPILGKILSPFLGKLFALQFVSIFAFGGILFFIARILISLFGDKKEIIIYTFLFCALSPYFLRSSILVMSDTLNTFFLIAGTYFLWLIAKRVNPQKDLVYALIGISLLLQAPFTRYASAIWVLYLGLVFCFQLLPLFSHKQKIIVICYTAMIAFILLYTQSTFLQQGTHHSHLQNWSFYHFFQSDFLTGDGVLHYKYNNFFYGLSYLVHPGFGLLGIVFLLFLKKQSLFANDNRIYFFLFPLLLYYLFLMGVPFQNPRFYVLSFPFLMIVYFGPFLELMARIEAWKIKKVFYIVVFICQISFSFFSFQKIWQLNQLEQKIAKSLLNYPKYKQIYTLGLEGCLQAYQVNMKITSLYSQKISTFESPSLALIQTKVFEKQWDGQIPMENWNELKSHCTIRKIKDFDAGWQLFEIEK